MVRITRALHQYDPKGCCKLIIRYCICCLSRYGPMTTRAARKISRDFRTTKTLVSKQMKDLQMIVIAPGSLCSQQRTFYLA